MGNKKHKILNLLLRLPLRERIVEEQSTQGALATLRQL